MKKVYVVEYTSSKCYAPSAETRVPIVGVYTDRERAWAAAKSAAAEERELSPEIAEWEKSETPYASIYYYEECNFKKNNVSITMTEMQLLEGGVEQ